MPIKAPSVAAVVLCSWGRAVAEKLTMTMPAMTGPLAQTAEKR